MLVLRDTYRQIAQVRGHERARHGARLVHGRGRGTSTQPRLLERSSLAGARVLSYSLPINSAARSSTAQASTRAGARGTALLRGLRGLRGLVLLR